MKIITVCLLISVISLHAQNFGTGAIFNQNEFDKSPKAPPLSRGDLVQLPKFYSLKKYAPKPGNQGTTATCTGWAISYEARTILEAVNNGWDRVTINRNAFSPSFLYNQIRHGDGCNNGASLIDGMELIKDQGVLPLNEFGYNCDRKVSEVDKINASKYRIREYRQILDRYSKNKILSVKKSISQNKPVVIGINCPKSFYSAKDVWKPKKDEISLRTNGHAVTVVGYDDNKFSGAFEIINSWGINWGDSGFTWIRYDDFENFCVWAGELIGFKKQNYFALKAEIQLKDLKSREISFEKKERNYKSIDTFKTGDMFQLFVKNEQPAYAYIFSYDSSQGTVMLFPNDTLTSEFLAYNENNIVIPSENYAFELDDHQGVSSMIIILSNTKLIYGIYDLFKINKGKIEFEKLLNRLSIKNESFNSNLIDYNKIKIDCKSHRPLISIIKIDLAHIQKEN